MFWVPSRVTESQKELTLPIERSVFGDGISQIGGCSIVTDWLQSIGVGFGRPVRCCILVPSCCSSSWVVLERDDVTAAEFDRLRLAWDDAPNSDRGSLPEGWTRSGETGSAEVESRETGSD
jgi:hypothetical protein